MTVKLFLEAIFKFTLGFVLLSLLIFLPAGTFSYFYGWLFMALLFIPMFFAGIFPLIGFFLLIYMKRYFAKQKNK